MLVVEVCVCTLEGGLESDRNVKGDVMGGFEDGGGSVVADGDGVSGLGTERGTLRREICLSAGAGCGGGGDGDEGSARGRRWVDCTGERGVGRDECWMWAKSTS